MTGQDTLDYARIAQAIGYIRDNFKRQPRLEEVAAQVALSPAHFQRMFTDWAGISPKKFLQYTSIDHAKKILAQTRTTLLDAAVRTGLSGTGRLHDLFVGIEGMTPGEYKNGGENLSISYSFAPTPFGEVIVASTGKGICALEFVENRASALASLQRRFANAKFSFGTDSAQCSALRIFSQDWSCPEKIRLYLKGTEFQLKVWQALLRIPSGGLSSYGDIAAAIGRQGAGRAVGGAIGDNPVAYIIPCHRVILSSGHTGNYHWGELRKAAIIGWEAAQNDKR